MNLDHRYNTEKNTCEILLKKAWRGLQVAEVKSTYSQLKAAKNSLYRALKAHGHYSDEISELEQNLSFLEQAHKVISLIDAYDGAAA